MKIKLTLICFIIFFVNVFAQVPLVDPPANVEVFPGDNKVYIRWNKVSDPNFISYKVVHGDETTVTTTTDTFYVDTNVSNDVYYSYAVVSINSAGNDGNWSKQVWVTPKSRSDIFGYSWTSNMDIEVDIPSFYWDDISKSGSLIPFGGVQNLGDFPIGFSFPFYNFVFDSFRISNSGYISFTSLVQMSQFETFPTGATDRYGSINHFEDFIAPAWSYQADPKNDKIYYLESVEKLIIQYEQTNGALNYQIVLYPDGTFDMIYKDFSDAGMDGYSVGWQNYSQQDGINVDDDYSILMSNLIVHAEVDFSGFTKDDPQFYFSGITELGLQFKTASPQAVDPIYSVNSSYISGYYAEHLVKYQYAPIDIQVDLKHNKIYWIDNDTELGNSNISIRRADLDGSNVEILVSDPKILTNPKRMVLDLVNDKMYWNDYNSHKIFQSDLAGTGIVSFLGNNDGVFMPMGLALDLENGYIYWGDGSDGMMMRSRLDKPAGEVAFDGAFARDIEIYPGENTIYWLTESRGFTIKKADLDGSNPVNLYTDLVPMYGIKLDPGADKLYFTSALVSSGDILFKADASPSSLGLISYDLSIGKFDTILADIGPSPSLTLGIISTPIHFSAGAIPGIVRLKWPNVPESGLTGSYKIYRGNSPFPTKLLKEVSKSGGDTTYYEDQNITHLSHYYYRVAAVDKRGLLSGFSAQDSVTAIGSPDIAFNPNSIDFGSVENSDSKIETFAVFNNGDTDLNIFEMGFKQGDYFHFPPVKSDVWIIGPGDSLIVGIEFAPGVGKFSDSLYVISNDYVPESDSLQYVALAGTGLNHPPSPFNLIEPAHLDSLTIEEFNQITFKWHAATDEDEHDLIYNLSIADLESDTTFTNISDTTLTLKLVNFLDYDKPYAWSVFVSDGHSVTASADTFAFFTPLLSGIGDVEGTVPTVYSLHNNYPNPFNPSTTIRYDLPKASHVSLSVYNVLGQLVKVLVDGEKPLGVHTVVWDGKDRFGVNVSSGIYMLVMRSGNFTSVQKMTLMK